MSEVPPGGLCSEAVGRDSCFGPSDREVEHFVKAALAMARRTSSRNESDWQRTFVHPPFNSELVIHHEHGGRERFHLKSLLAKGGMGMVYRAIDDRFGRTLAVKLIHPEQRTNSQFLGRFFREAILQARLQHPGIPAVYAYGIDPALGPFLAMKLVEGRTLSEILQDHFASPRSGLDPLLELLRQVAETLAYCHDRGVIHRDVKPSNIMVGTYGEVYLMDWGLAKSSGSDSDVVNEPTEPAPRQSSSL
ncbi:serine/threonine protein kinase [Isosphaera pallida ATCC 43644]|uniref:Serine/threonine protein kinase n=1 Tax=Isosphaera pallida (strain ATCC 43644 / DSM 9630 / IS1B) TaxID=575540 RepID=E8R6D9_ISOPI|nr:serine/threonine-protein kinase [Isosphaera pallida]ADV61840.1 serine/threonine protein kinase [Isosphaera pallida ATCC 43644]